MAIGPFHVISTGLGDDSGTCQHQAFQGILVFSATLNSVAGPYYKTPVRPVLLNFTAQLYVQPMVANLHFDFPVTTFPVSHPFWANLKL
jgi:hypothetical protein